MKPIIIFQEDPDNLKFEYWIYSCDFLPSDFAECRYSVAEWYNTVLKKAIVMGDYTDTMLDGFEDVEKIQTSSNIDIFEKLQKLINNSDEELLIDISYCNSETMYLIYPLLQDKKVKYVMQCNPGNETVILNNIKK